MRNTIEGLGRVTDFFYSGKCLQYLIQIQEDIDHVAVSGDPETPFGGHSFYEFVIPCDSIRTFPDPYVQGQRALGFYYGDPTDPANLRLTIMKRPDGDLKVWPEYPAPEGHILRKRGGK